MESRHYFHLVSPSPWPFFTGISLFCITSGAAMFFHFYKIGPKLLILGLISLISCMFFWWRDIIVEGTYQGAHSLIVQQGLRFGIVLFIISEIMFFFSFFWAFFHSSLAPNIEIGSVWPPAEIYVFNPWQVPLLNTLLLLTSGCTVTWAHYLICVASPVSDNIIEVSKKENFLIKKIYLTEISKDRGDFENGNLAFSLTLFLAILFTFFQGYEYFEAPFSILDGIYGSTFFMLTGFHGMHVIVGTIFLTVCAFRYYYNQFSTLHHIGFEGAVWYWHFVDVVWLFLFIIVYYWGGKISFL